MASSMSTFTHIDSAGPLLLQLWLSPAFPVGSYSYSHGLESAVESGIVKTRHDLERWIGGVLSFGTGRSDALLLRESHRAVVARAIPRFVELAAFAAALKGTAELALEAEAQGAAFQKALAAGWPFLVLREPFLAIAQAAIRPPYVIAFAAAAALAGIEMHLALLSYLQAFVGNLVLPPRRLLLRERDADGLHPVSGGVADHAAPAAAYVEQPVARLQA